MASTGKLKVVAQGEREIVMTRAFDAPRRLVYDALTKPELLKQWLLGPPGMTMPVCEMDLKVGGAYRFVWRGPDGKDMGVRGTFREVTPPQGFAAIENFDEAWYPGEALITYSLAEQGGKTTLTLTVRYESQAARDAVLKTPMERGLGMSYDRLEALLAAKPRKTLETTDPEASGQINTDKAKGAGQGEDAALKRGATFKPTGSAIPKRRRVEKSQG